MAHLPENFREKLGSSVKHSMKVGRYEKNTLVIAEIIDIERVSSSVQKMLITGTDAFGKWWKLVTLDKYSIDPNPWRVVDQ